ncbi:MAG: ATP-binding protein, partial [Bacillota bacterium]
MLFEREDWKLFRNMETLPQKAGVPESKLSMLVCKELVDNALDLCGACEIGYEGDLFYVKDRGVGLDPDLFSISRPLRSSKYLRLPTRGALGNGLRVAASGGELHVCTRGKHYRIHFQKDGTALPECLKDYPEEGTKISFNLGEMPLNLNWASMAIDYARGEIYRGKTSPWWYTSENFFELFQAFRGSVRDLITQFDGCTGSKAGKIAGEYTKTPAAALSFAETEALLAQLRGAVTGNPPAPLR